MDFVLNAGQGGPDLALITGPPGIGSPFTESDADFVLVVGTLVTGAQFAPLITAIGRPAVAAANFAVQTLLPPFFMKAAWRWLPLALAADVALTPTWFLHVGDVWEIFTSSPKIIDAIIKYATDPAYEMPFPDTPFPVAVEAKPVFEFPQPLKFLDP